MNEQINVLLELMEEIKQQNRELKANVAELANGLNETTKVEKSGEIPEELQQAILFLAKQHNKLREDLTNAFQMIGTRLKELKQSAETNTEEQKESEERITKIIEQTQVQKPINKYVLFDVKRKFEWMFWILTVLLLASCLGWTAYLQKHNQELEDYALRYRVLRMEHRHTPNEYERLDSIFDSHRSENKIAKLRKQVIEYEAAVQRQAELLHRQQKLTQEQERLKKRLKN